jgi:lipid-A-disaccharide synthase
VILTNLVLGENAVPEFIQTDCTPEKLSQALAPLLRDSPERQKQVTALARLDGLMEIGTAQPASRAADIVERVAIKSRRPA